MYSLRRDHKRCRSDQRGRPGALDPSERRAALRTLPTRAGYRTRTNSCGILLSLIGLAELEGLEPNLD